MQFLNDDDACRVYYVDEMGFRCTTGDGGFHLYFKGVTLSTQFKLGNYCGSLAWQLTHDNKLFFESPNAEIAIWRNDCERSSGEGWITGSTLKAVTDDCYGEDVAGYLTPELWLKLYAYLVKEHGEPVLVSRPEEEQ